MKKISFGNGQYVMRFDSGADDFYFDSGNTLYAADALLGIAGGDAGEMLCIWGGFGSGKSHLLRGFYRDMKASMSSGAKIISAKALSDELMTAICTGSVAALAERYAALRLLVVEDMDAICGKETMQNVFMQLFESIVAAGCSVVFSSAEHPEVYTELHALLVSCGGTVVELSYPDADCRRNYAVATCVEWGVYISLDEAEALAESFASVPQLRGAIFSRALRSAAA